MLALNCVTTVSCTVRTIGLDKAEMLENDGDQLDRSCEK
jgi:hypothetical protein